MIDTTMMVIGAVLGMSLGSLAGIISAKLAWKFLEKRRRFW